MKPTNSLNNSTTGETKIFNFKFDQFNYCDTINDNNFNSFIKKFLPIVEASNGIDDFDSSSLNSSKNSNNVQQQSSSSSSSNSATTTSCNGNGSNSKTTFHSPFSRIDFSMLFNNNNNTNNTNDSTTATNFLSSNSSMYNCKTTTTTTTTKNNHHHQATTTTNNKSTDNNRTELVHHQDYLNNNILSGFNNNLNNINSLTTNIINFVHLSTNSATILPSIFTIKTIVNNNTTSHSTNQVQQKNKIQPLVNNNNNQNTLRKSSSSSSSSSSFIDNSSSQIASTTNIASTLSSESSSKPPSSTLLHPGNNFINKSNNTINYKQDNTSDNINNFDSIHQANTSINSSKTKFQFIPTSTSYNGEEENFNTSRKFSNQQPNEDYDLVDEEILDIVENDIADNLSTEIDFSNTNFFDQIFSSDPKFRHLTLADKIRFERLFREIDVDGNGVIDFNDLLHALERKGIQATHENVKHLILRSDINLDGDIDFSEFVSYCLENEKQLHIIFKDIDVNDDGMIDTHELVLAFTRAGIRVDEQEALRLVRRIKADSKNSNTDKLELNYAEFRDYLLLHPTDSLQDLMRSWRFGTFVDFGEDGIMPVDFSEKEIQSGMWWRHMLAGGVAGAVSRTSTAPLDRLKVFLQVRGAEFNGLGVCLKHMIQEGGVWSLWRGNGINVIKIAPETAIKFMAFDQLKRIIHSGNSGSEISIIERFLAGSLAGAVSQTAIYPMEVLKTRFCLRQTGQYRGLFDAAKKIYANGGIKNFYRGYVPNLIGIIPYAGIDLTIYETLKKMYMTRNSLEEAPVYVCLTCGTVSSTFGQIASYPLALIRTRMQSESGNHRSSMVDMFRTIMKNEGPRGLYRGITANIMKVAPAVSISYVVYEYNRRALGAVMT